MPDDNTSHLHIAAAQPGFNPEYSEAAPSFEELSNLQGEAIIEFGAPWCGHCQGAESAISDALRSRKTSLHIKVFDGKGKRLGRVFGVKLWPTLIRIVNGVEVSRVVRPTTANDMAQLMEANP